MENVHKSDMLAAFLGMQKFVDWEDEGYSLRAFAFADRVRPGLIYLKDKLENNVTEESTEEEIQYWFYEAGKLDFKDELRTWFRVLYQLINRQDSGSRFGIMVKLMRKEYFIRLLSIILDNKVPDTWGWPSGIPVMLEEEIDFVSTENVAISSHTTVSGFDTPIPDMETDWIELRNTIKEQRVLIETYTNTLIKNGIQVNNIPMVYSMDEDNTFHTRTIQGYVLYQKRILNALQQMI